MAIQTFQELLNSKQVNKSEIDEVDQYEKLQEEVQALIDTTTKEIIKEPIRYSEPIRPEQFNTNAYNLYRDKQEIFSCEVMIEGASLNNSHARLIIECSEWNLLFNGTIDRFGKCIIPIKKLPILSEGANGKIKLEIIAEDTVFIPWEEDFVVKNNKHVTVNVLEQERRPENSINVRVNI